MKTLGRLMIAGLVVFACVQLIRPSIPEGPKGVELRAPADVKHVIEKDCYSCHSNERRLAWFDQIVPGYWLVRHDILTARQHLNFSTLGSKPAALQQAALYEAVNMVQLGAMPLPQFRKLHPEANVTPEELAVLKVYLAPWTSAPNQPGNAPAGAGVKTDAAPASVSGNEPEPISLATVRPELNAFPFDSSFESWKPLSTTDRGDNSTLRFIFGNDIAFKAAQHGNISPWPDGARFAKIAWEKELGADGLIHPGKFVQVELMEKDAQRYHNTDGWGWGRWRGLDLKPYGQDGGFVRECTGCHQPVRGNDYVYTLPMTPAHVNGQEVVNNAAVLPASLPYHPLDWNAITMYVDPKHHTMATLYCNDAAMQAVNSRGARPGAMNSPKYSASAVLALVTWVQREDPHWFGGRIPYRPESVEFVQMEASGQANRYRSFAGSGLAEERVDTGTVAQRMTFILALPPARLP